MILADKNILEHLPYALNGENLNLVDPYLPWLIQPASYDVRLGTRILKPDSYNIYTVQDPDIDPQYTERKTPYQLAPDEFILCHTLEKVNMPPWLAGKFEGKSSLGRLGLMTHVTAGFIDPGFRGNLTLEVKNIGNNTLILNAGIKIGQISFMQMATEPEHKYGDLKLGSHYQNSEGVVGYRN